MIRFLLTILVFTALLFPAQAMANSTAFEHKLYQPGKLKPIDSQLKVKIGASAPGFTLPSVSGQPISLDSFKGKKNVLISFVPAAWTPVCSDQWPGYNLARPLFEQRDTVLLGITTDNIPTLYSWTLEMGHLWFNVLSDFWPHGKTASAIIRIPCAGSQRPANY